MRIPRNTESLNLQSLTLNPKPQTLELNILKLPCTLRLKIAQKPYIVWSLDPKALKYESLEPKG